MSWFGQVRKKAPKLTGSVGGSVEVVSSGSMDPAAAAPADAAGKAGGGGGAVLEGGGLGLYNPLAWDSMPSALQEKFPHWKEGSLPGSKAQANSSAQDQGYSYYKTTKHQPDYTFPYVVMDNDTLNSIAVKFETTPAELARLNKKPLGMNSTIFSGEVLYVPDQDEIARSTPKSAPPQLTSVSGAEQFQESVESGGTLRSSSDSQPPDPALYSEGDSAPHSKDDPAPQSDRSPSPGDAKGVLEGEEGGLEGGPSSTSLGKVDDEFFEEVAESHIVLLSRYISDDQGCAHGHLMINRTAIMFTPFPSEALVKEHGSANFEVMIPLQDITFAAFTRDVIPPSRKKTNDGLVSDGRVEEEEGMVKQIPLASKDDDSLAINGESCSKDEDVTKEEGEAREEDLAKSEEGKEEEGSVKDEGAKEVGLVKDAEEGVIDQGEMGAREQEGDVTQEEVEREECVGGQGKEVEEEEKKGDDLGNQVTEVVEERTGEAVNNGGDQPLSPGHGDGGLNAEGGSSRGHPNQPSCSSTDELLAIMGAEPPTPHTTNHTSECPADNLSDQPCFLHLRVSRKCSAAHTYTPINLPVGIDIPQNKGFQSSRGVIQQVRTAFCFAVAERWMSDLVNFISRHHPGGASSCEVRSPVPSIWSDGSFEFIAYDEAAGHEDLNFSDNHFMGAESSESWEICSLKDMSKFRRIIDKMEVEHELPLPHLSEKSDLLKEAHLRALSPNLISAAIGHDWVLIYSTFKHGISLRTLYRNMQLCELAEPAIILLVRDDQNKLFGTAVTARLRVSEKFYGTGESFLFSFESPTELQIYPWTGANNYIIKGNTDSVGFGCDDGHYGLWLDEYLLNGSSLECSTFGNACLASATEFTCTGLEAWGFC